MNILICGGAGYIGSHMVKMLHTAGHSVTVFDNLSTGHKEAVKWGTFVEGDLLDQKSLDEVFLSGDFRAVMHFSAKSLVGESVENPAIYYENNVIGTFNLLEVMRLHDVKKIVFSSSAAIFGNPVKEFIDEQHPKKPINPYGQTKLIVENMLSDYFDAYGLCSVSLRYFNAAGADPEGELGESHDPETHLIPNVLRSVKNGSNTLKVFGNNYQTKDGTCIRDYIYVNDLCDAHLLALEYMEKNEGTHGFNLGNGRGFSILDIIKASEEVTGTQIKFQYAAPRIGDPPILVADSKMAREELGWTPKYQNINDVIQTAWIWHQN